MVVEDWEKGKTWIKESNSKEEVKVNNVMDKEKWEMKYDVMDVLVYGPSNSGKTYFACTCPEPIVILDTEGRANLTKKYQFPNKNIEVVELLEVKEEFIPKSLSDAIDISGTIDKITQEIIRLNRKAKSGEIKGGTVVIDSLTDIWSWAQYKGKDDLAKAGKVDMNLCSLKFAPDWSIINGINYRLVIGLRNLLRYGVNVIGTARFGEIPDFAAEKMATTPTFESEIRSQKDTAFWFSTIVKLHLQKQRVLDKSEVKLKYLSEIKKLETFDIKETDVIEGFNFQKLKEIREKYREQVKGGNQ